MTTGQAWSLVQSVLAERRILVVHFLEMLDSLAVDLEAIPAHKPTIHQHATASIRLLVVKYQRIFFLYDQLFRRDRWPHCSRHDEFCPLKLSMPDEEAVRSNHGFKSLGRRVSPPLEGSMHTILDCNSLTEYRYLDLAAFGEKSWGSAIMN